MTRKARKNFQLFFEPKNQKFYQLINGVFQFLIGKLFPWKFINFYIFSRSAGWTWPVTSKFFRQRWTWRVKRNPSMGENFWCPKKWPSTRYNGSKLSVSENGPPVNLFFTSLHFQLTNLSLGIPSPEMTTFRLISIVRIFANHFTTEIIRNIINNE